MAKVGKKYKAALAKVESQKLYPTTQAVALVKDTSITKFDGTVECHVRLGVDPRQNDQQVRGVVVLPHGLGKTVRVLVFAQGDGARIAQEAGADIVADTDDWRLSPLPESLPTINWFSPAAKRHAAVVSSNGRQMRTRSHH